MSIRDKLVAYSDIASPTGLMQSEEPSYTDKETLACTGVVYDIFAEYEKKFDPIYIEEQPYIKQRKQSSKPLSDSARSSPLDNSAREGTGDGNPIGVLPDIAAFSISNPTSIGLDMTREEQCAANKFRAEKNVLSPQKSVPAQCHP